MTIPTQLVLRALLADPAQELYGVEIGTAAGLPSGTVHPILARLEGVGWLTSRWEEIDPRAEGRPARRYYQLTPDGARAGPGRPGPRLQRHRPACLAATPWAMSHDRPVGVPGDRPGGPAHLVGQLGGPLGLAAPAVRAPLPVPPGVPGRAVRHDPLRAAAPRPGVLSRVWTLRVALVEPARLLTQGRHRDRALGAAPSASTPHNPSTTPNTPLTPNTSPAESNRTDRRNSLRAGTALPKDDPKA